MKEIDKATPGIEYLSNSDLLALDESWYEQIESLTRAEAHLLTKTRADLEPAARDGRVTIAVDTNEGGRVVGCIVLWELACDQDGTMWYELGTYVVVPDHRFKARGARAMPIGDVLYGRLLAEHWDKNILGTTTNPSAIHTGMRHRMQMIRFGALPEVVRLATCICPMSKTGVRDNAHCRIRDQVCRMRVTHQTWERMGCPERLPYC